MSYELRQANEILRKASAYSAMAARQRPWRSAEAAGGEEGPVHSVGMLLVRREAWPIADLRVDWADEDPIGQIATLWERWKGEMEAYVSRALNPSVAPSYGVPGNM